MNKTQRAIIHVDMDCFYAAVETLDNPDLKGKPVIVGALPNTRGVVSACNYKARKYGIHSAMPISKAFKLCPKGIFLRVNMARYKEISQQIINLLFDFTDIVEQISIDEAFVDITDTKRLFGNYKNTALKIKNRIKEKTGLTASVGLAPNKFIAKIASDLDKPDGFVCVAQDQIFDFLDNLSVSKIWGIGQKTFKILKNLGINNIKELRDYPENALHNKLTPAICKHIKDLSRGIDKRKIIRSHVIKSISHEHTFQKDTNNIIEIKKSLFELAEKVMVRLRNKDLLCKTFYIKIKTTDFINHTKEISQKSYTDSTKDALDFINSFLKDMIKSKIRLIGFGTKNLIHKNENQPGLLFEPQKEKSANINLAYDKIIKKYGSNSIKRGLLYLD